MVPIVNKPTIQHILELVQRHGINEVVMTLAFLPRLIRNYFGDGSSLGMHIDYTVEETPAGTAGSIRLAKDLLDETFWSSAGRARRFRPHQGHRLPQAARSDGDHRPQERGEPARVRRRHRRRRRSYSAVPGEAGVGAGVLRHGQYTGSTSSSPRSSTTSPKVSPTTSAMNCFPSCSTCASPCTAWSAMATGRCRQP